MRRFLLALLMMFGVASLQAISISWTVANSDRAWDANATSYLVYSESGNLTYDQVYQGTNHANTVVTTSGGTLTGVNYYLASDFSAEGTTKATIDVNLAAGAVTGGYFYLVVFNNAKDTNGAYTGEYVVSKAVQYVEGNSANGIYDLKVDGSAPEAMNYFEPEWLGGHWAAVPEPTALALLALGVAGLALRRKI